MEKLLSNLELRAATIDELLSDTYRPLPGQKADAEKASARLAAWCRASASGNWQLFTRRLARDGLSMEAVLSRLATVSRNPDAPRPKWILDAAWILSSLTTDIPSVGPRTRNGARQPIAFETILANLVAAAEKKILSHIEERGLTRIGEAALHDLSRNLLQQISELCSPALFEHLGRWKAGCGKSVQASMESKESKESNNSSAPTDDAFQQFVSFMRAAGFIELFTEKPVLLRLLASITGQWLDSTEEFIVRIESDYAEIRRFLVGFADDSSVTYIRGGLSDLHNHGRSVLLVGFEDGSRVLYKPKDLRPDAQFHDLIAWLNNRNPPIDLQVPKVIVRPHYGWAQFIDHTDSNGSEGIARFYTRAGAWLALFHVFAATDMHLENMIACGDHPVPIDLEMICQAEELDLEERIPERKAMGLARRRIADSALSVGLLPAYTRSLRNNIVALGGLDGAAQETSELYWENIDTLNVRPARRVRSNESGPNIPTYDGAPAPPRDHIQSVQSGFEEYGRFLIENKSSIVERGTFTELAGIPLRTIIRPTRFYAYLIERLKDVRNMEDGARWSADLDFASRLADWDKLNEPLWPIFRAERNALAELNVPLFLAQSDASILSDIDGIGTHDRRTSGLQRAFDRLAHLDAEELDWQSRVVKISINSIPGANEKETRSQDRVECRRSLPEEYSARAAFEDCARTAAAHIREVAFRSGPGAAWIGMDWLGDSEACQLVPLGFDLYNGAPGIALFLAAFASSTGDSQAAELSIAGLAHLRSHLKGSNAGRLARGLGIGAATGMGSIVYALATIGAMLTADDIVSDAFSAARLINTELIGADKHFDVIGGSAGAILGLLKLYKVTGEKDALTRAVECGAHLMNHRSQRGQEFPMWPCFGSGLPTLTGASHGAAGLAHALTALHQACGQEEFAHAANDCIRYENALFSETYRNWPDLRQSDSETRFPCQWCYGAGGIGLARIAMLKNGYPDRSALLSDIERAVGCTKQALSTNDTLCCGDLGNIEFLHEAGILRDDKRLCDDAERWMTWIVRDAEQRGDYRWGGGDRQFSLGLFRGLAGIAYTALRRIEPHLPNVLIWE